MIEFNKMEKSVFKIQPETFSIDAFIKLTRVPNLAIIAFTQYFTAVFLVFYGEHWRDVLLDYRLLLLVLSTVLIAAAGYIINDYYDVKIDFVNKPERVVVDKILKRRVVMVAHSVLNFIGLALAALVAWKVLAINFIAAVLLWLYSNQLKRLPFIGNFTVGILTAASLIVVSVYYERSIFLVVTYGVFAFSISLIREIVKDIEDMKGDQVFGCKTLPLVWGIRKTKFFIYILTAVFVSLLFYLASVLNNSILIIYFILLLPMIGYFIFRLAKSDTRKDFGYLSSFCKMIMLTGVLSMIFFA